MKIKILSFLGIGILLTISIIIIMPAEINSRRQTKINMPINELSPQITNLRNWVKWFPELNSTDSSRINFSHSDSVLTTPDLTLHKTISSPAFLEVIEKSNETFKYHSIELIPDSFGFATRIIWTERTKLSTWIKNRITSNHQTKEQNAFSFKQFAENTKRFFGYDIVIKPVEDTLVMTSHKACARTESLSTLKSLYNDIEQIALTDKIQIDANESKLGAFQPIGSDSLMVMAGIPVKKKSSSHKGISYLEMPANGRMLVGYYEGPYSGIDNLYKSMERYVLIRSLSKIATPFEKYLTTPKSASDSLHMKIELFYPIL